MLRPHKPSKKKRSRVFGDNTSPVIKDAATRLAKSYAGRRDELAKVLSWSLPRVDNLLDRQTTNPWTFLASAPKLAYALGDRRADFVQRIVSEFVPAGYPVAQQLAAAMGNKGVLAEPLALSLGMRLETLLRFLNGVLDAPPEKHEAGFADFLGITRTELKNALRESRTRRRYPTIEVGSSVGGTAVCELIYDLCQHECSSPTEFAAAHHFTPGNIRDMLAGEQPPHVSADLLARLALALQENEKQVIHGIKLNSPMPVGPHPAVIKRMQERIDKSTVPSVAKEIGINRSTLTRILQTQNLCVASATTTHAVRKWLGLGWTQFVELARQKDRNLKSIGRRSLTSAVPEEDAEVSLLRYWRKAPDDRRAAAMDVLMGVSV